MNAFVYTILMAMVVLYLALTIFTMMLPALFPLWVACTVVMVFASIIAIVMERIDRIERKTN